MRFMDWEAEINAKVCLILENFNDTQKTSGLLMGDLR